MVEHPESIAPACPWHREGWGTQLGLSCCPRGVGAVGRAASSPRSPPLQPTGPGVSRDSRCVPGQTWCDAFAAASPACPEDGVTAEHGLRLGWRGVLCPHEPPPARSGHLPWCWANASPCLPPPRHSCCRALARSSFVVPLPPALVQGLLLSASLCVLPVVLPYGRLRHAVLPQGRTTDGMPGLPLRPRTPVSLCGPGSKARTVPVPRCFKLGMGLAGGGSGCVCAQPPVCVCVHVYVCDSPGGTEPHGACRDPRCSERGLQQSEVFLAGVSRSPSQTTHSTPGVEDALAESRQGPALAAAPRGDGHLVCAGCAVEAHGCPLCRGAASPRSPWAPRLLEPLVTALPLPLAPGSGSSSCPTRCSTPCTASSSTLARTTTACRSTLPPPSTLTTSPTSASSAASSPW